MTPVAYAKYYINDPNAPKPNRPTHLGVNVLVEYDGKLLLERRRDCGQWGLPGGKVQGREPEVKAIAREVQEETGLWLPESSFERVKVFSERGRIASYADGSVWRMVVILYRVKLNKKPELRVSKESKELGWFTRQELQTLSIPVTHQDMVKLF